MLTSGFAGPMAHDHGHHHDDVAFDATEVADDTLRALDASHPALAEVLSLTRRWRDLSPTERADAVAKQAHLEDEGPWHVGFHAEGDRCAVCGETTRALFEDRLVGGASVPFAAFAADLPVHPACAAGFAAKFPRLAPAVIDRARRSLVADFDRPASRVASFFRHDLLQHGPFALEDWANSVAEANATLTRAQARDIDKCLHWLHHRIHH